MISQIKNKSNGKIINTIKDNLGRIIYEAFKELIVSGIPPLALSKSIGKDLVDYKVYGNSVQGIIHANPLQVGDYSSGTNRVSTVKYLEVKPNVTYTSTRKNFRTYFYNSNKVQIGRADTGNQNNKVTTIENTAYIRCVWFGTTDITEIIDLVPIPTPEAPIEIKSVGDFDEITGKYKIPIKVNNDVTNIYLDEPLRKVGDYADYIDFENQKVVRQINSYTFTGNETYSVQGNSNLYSMIKIKGMPQAKSLNALCSHYKNTNLDYDRVKDNNVFQFGNSYINLGNAGYTLIDDFKNWLKTQKVEIIWVSTLTPTEETIELPNIPTYKGTNIIEVDTEIQPSNMAVKYKGLD